MTTLTFTGCRTHADAIERYRAWMQQEVIPYINQRNEAGLLLAVQQGHTGAEQAADALEWMREGNEAVIETAVNDFRQWLEEHMPHAPLESVH